MVGCRGRSGRSSKTKFACMHLRRFDRMRQLKALGAWGIAWLLSMCNVSAQPTAGTAPIKKWWIVNVAALKSLADRGLSETIARYFFDNEHTLITRKPEQKEFLNWRALNVRTFTSFREFQRCLSDGKMNRNVQAVLYDNESWRFTPQEEQLHIAEYESKVAALAHEHGFLLVSTPASDLVRTLAPDAGPGEKYNAFIRLGIAADAARVSDVYEIQAQGSEMNVNSFSRFVRAAARQAREANPNVIVLAGLSTGPSGHKVTADQIVAAAISVADVVDGYWLNIPGKSPYCPSCTTPRGDIGARFLEKFYRRQGNSE